MMYYTQKNYAKSTKYGLMCLESAPTTVNRELTLNFLSRALSNLHQNDSAKFYINLIYEGMKTPINRYSYLLNLVEFEKNRGNFEIALQYTDIANKLEDSIRREAQKHNLFQVEKQFDKQRVEIKNSELEYAANVRLLIIIIACLALSVVLTLFLIAVTKQKQKQQKHQELVN